MKVEPSIRKKAVFFLITGLIAFLTLTITKASSKEDFSFSEKNEEEVSLFVETSKNFIREDTEINFVEDNSIVSVASPLIYTNITSLGSFLDSEEEKKQIKEYIVEKEDTVASISEKFNISVNTILWANKLNNNSKLKEGQKLVILPITGLLHEVKKGDTTGEIAKKYKAKIEEIVSFNELEDEGSIFIGDILIVPNGQMPVVVPKIVTPSVSGFIVPAKGTITQRLHFYNAVDIANSCGTPIYASASGTIQLTGYHNIGGNYVRIIHPSGVVTYYGHLSRISVSKNQKVSQGQIIGYMGNTGYTIGRTGCHIHFEVRGATNPFGQYKLGHIFR